MRCRSPRAGVPTAQMLAAKPLKNVATLFPSIPTATVTTSAIASRTSAYSVSDCPSSRSVRRRSACREAATGRSRTSAVDPLAAASPRAPQSMSSGPHDAEANGTDGERPQSDRHSDRCFYRRNETLTPTLNLRIHQTEKVVSRSPAIVLLRRTGRAHGEPAGCPGEHDLRRSCAAAGSAFMAGRADRAPPYPPPGAEPGPRRASGHGGPVSVPRAAGRRRAGTTARRPSRGGLGRALGRVATITVFGSSRSR